MAAGNAKKGRKPQRATIEAVAEKAGVSRSTVSRVLTKSPLVSDQAKKAVEEAIEELSYVPSRAAQSLAKRKTGIAVLVVPEDIQHFFSEPFFVPVIQGIDEELSKADYILTMFIASSDARERGEQYLLSGAADGVFILSHRLADETAVALAAKIPVVFGGLPPSPEEHPHFVDSDNKSGGYLAARHLIDSGHTRIAIITGDMEMPASTDRLEGFNEALVEEGLKPVGVVDGKSTRQGGNEALETLLEEADIAPTAVFVAGDLMARGVVDRAEQEGLEVPVELAIVGFDDAAAATSQAPSLTTIRQRLDDYGRAMAVMLLDLIKTGKAEGPVRLPVELVKRETT